MPTFDGAVVGERLRSLADVFSQSVRSQIMARIRRRDTAPELAVRAALRRRGHRFSGDRSDLPGTPDVALSNRNVAIFVHGCFWHRHAGCRFTTTPSSNRKFWFEKFARNVARDRRVSRQLRALGWSVITIWECDTRDSARLQRVLSSRIARTREGSKVRRRRRRREG